MRRLLKTITNNDIPAPAPLEQRWSASSRSYMSPVGVTKGTNCTNDIANGVIEEDTIHCWVGIIMYLPTSNGSKEVDQIRKEITEYVHSDEPIAIKFDAVKMQH